MVALISLIGASCASIRLGNSESALVLEALAASGGSTRLAANTTTPQRRSVSLAVAGKNYQASLFTPATPRRAAIVLVPGLAPAGRNDPRLVRFADTLGRVGFEVWFPTSQDFAPTR